MTIFCTGRSGSIGQHLPPAVRGLDTRLEASETEMRRELAALVKPGDTMIHLAALTSPKICEKDPRRATELNADAAERWLRAAAAVGVSRFVFASTSHVFKPTKTATWLDPSRVPDAQTAYGSSKAEGERRVVDEGAALRIDVRVARVFSVIADDMRPGFLYPALVERARTRNLAPLPGWANVRDFTPAARVATSLVNIATTASATSVFHVCTGEPRTVRALAEEVFGRFGIPAGDLTPMFEAGGAPPNYMISHPTKPEVQ